MRSYDHQVDVHYIVENIFGMLKKIFSSCVEISDVEYSRGLVTCVIFERQISQMCSYHIRAKIDILAGATNWVIIR